MFQMRLRLFATCLAILGFGVSAQAGQVTFTTTQAGGNVQIDSGNSQVWDFAVTSNAFAVSQILGQFVVKDGNSTSAPIVLSLYDTLNTTGHKSGTFTPLGNLLASVAVSQSTVTNQYASQNFTMSGLNLLAGNYSIVLTSTTGTNGSQQYFFKGGDLQTSAQGINLNPDNTPPPVSTPEPATLASAVVGMTLVAGVMRRRRAR